MATKLKNNWLSVCTGCSVIASVIGIFLFGLYIWRWFSTHSAEMFAIVRKLF